MQCAHLEKYEFVNGKDDIPYMKWKIKTCSKPPTRYDIPEKNEDMTLPTIWGISVGPTMGKWGGEPSKFGGDLFPDKSKWVICHNLLAYPIITFIGISHTLLPIALCLSMGYANKSDAFSLAAHLKWPWMARKWGASLQKEWDINRGF